MSVNIDPGAYYRLINNEFDTNMAMSCFAADHPYDVAMTRLGRFSSDNWQLFQQNDIYFIRNHDHNTTYHLGVKDSDYTFPHMLPAAPDMEQQWIISTWTNSSFLKITNKAISLNHSDLFLGTDSGADWNTPIMTSMVTGSWWTLSENPEAGRVPANMLDPVGTIEVPNLGTSQPSAGHGQLIGLEKTGIAIGVFVFVCMLFTAFFLGRRYKRWGSLRNPGVAGPVPPRRQPRHGDPEIVAEPPPAYHSRPNASFANQNSTLFGGTTGAYGSGGGKTRSIDERSIELPSYGQSGVEGRSFV